MEELKPYPSSDHKSLDKLHASASEWVRNAEVACDHARDVATTCNQRVAMLLSGLGQAVAQEETYNYPLEHAQRLRGDLYNLEFSAKLAIGALGLCKDVTESAYQALEAYDTLREPDYVTQFE